MTVPSLKLCAVAASLALQGTALSCRSVGSQLLSCSFTKAVIHGVVQHHITGALRNDGKQIQLNCERSKEISHDSSTMVPYGVAENGLSTARCDILRKQFLRTHHRSEKRSCTEHSIIDSIKLNWTERRLLAIQDPAYPLKSLQGGISVSLEPMIITRALPRLEIRVGELLDGRDNGDRDTGVHKSGVDDALQRAAGGQG